MPYDWRYPNARYYYDGGRGASIYRDIRQQYLERQNRFQLNEAQRTWWRTAEDGSVQLIPPEELRRRDENYCSVCDQIHTPEEVSRYHEPFHSITTFNVASSAGLNWDDIPSRHFVRTDERAIPVSNGEWQVQYLGQPTINIELTEPTQGRGQVTWNAPVDSMADIEALLESVGLGGYGYMHRDSGEQRQQALKKSKELLCSFLTDEQVQELDKYERITVKVNGKTYRIMATTAAYNVKVLDRNTAKWHGLCAVPKRSLPLYDTVLSQMLALQTDEAGFLKVANRENDYFSFNRWGENIVNGIAAGINSQGIVWPAPEVP